MLYIIIIVLLILGLGGGGWGYSRYGVAGGIGPLAFVLLVGLLLYFTGYLHG